MANTKMKRLVGVFDDYDSARKTESELINEGIARDQIQVVSNLKTGAAGSTSFETESAGERGGGVSGFFHRIFGGDVSDEERGHFAEAVRRGSAVVSVDVDERQIDSVIDTMNNNGAIDIDRRVAAYREHGYTGYDPNARPFSAEEAARDRQSVRQAEARIPVVEEQIRVGTREVRRGGVRVLSRVAETPVEERVQLHEEHVRVERRPVDRPVSEADLRSMKDQTIEVTETAEEPVVEKRTRVKEEIVVGKEASERTETIRDTLRHTEVKVEPIGGTSEHDEEFRRHYDSKFAKTGRPYDAYTSAYRFGYDAARKQDFKGKSWSDVESRLKSDYSKSFSDSRWEDNKDAVRYGWDLGTRR